MHRSLPLLVFICLLTGLRQPAALIGQEPAKKLAPQVVALIKGSTDDFLKHFDKKKQGFLTKDDVPPFMVKNFDKIDTNNDGKIDRAELDRFLIMMRKRLDAAPDPKKTDPPKGDTTVKGDTAKGDPAKGDPAKTGPSLDGLTLNAFDALDKKADGRLTRAMVKGTPFETHFDAIDANKDGKIDRQEFEAWLRRMTAKDKK